MAIVHIDVEKKGGDVSAMRRDLASLLCKLEGGTPVKGYFLRVDLEAVEPENVALSQFETKLGCQAFYGADDICGLPPESPIHGISPLGHAFVPKRETL